MMIRMMNTYTNLQKRSILLLAATLSLLLVISVSHAKLLDTIVAVVEDDVIMASELRLRISILMKQFAKNRSALPPEDILTQQVLDRMIDERVQLHRAQRRGIQVDDLALDQAMRNLAKRNNMSLEQFRDEMVNQELDYVNFREQVRNEMILGQLRRRVVDSRIEVTDAEIEKLMEEAHDNLLKKEYEYHLAHILIAVPENPKPGQIERAKNRAALVYDRATKGSNFEKLAIAASDAQDALQGGDLGWRSKLQISEIFLRQVDLMQPGEISKVDQSPAGYHIFKMIDRREVTDMMVTQVLSRHILINTNAVVTDQVAVRKLNELKSRIEHGEDFGELAKVHSEDTASAVDGGNLGWSVTSNYVPEFKETLENLSINEVSEPVKTRFGWHIVQLQDRRDHDSTEEAMRASAREQIMQRKIEEQTELWIREIRDESYIENRLQTSVEN